MKIEKKKFGCKFAILGNEKEGIPAIFLELPFQKEMIKEETILILFQSKGARELAECLLREADVFDSFINYPTTKGEHA